MGASWERGGSYIGRRWSVLWDIRKRVFMAFAAVYLLGFAPVLLSLVASCWNASIRIGPEPAQAPIGAMRSIAEEIAEVGAHVWPAVVADAYLYACIIALAGVWDSLNDRKQEATIAFGLLAGIAGLGEFTSLLEALPKTSVIWRIQSVAVWYLLAGVASYYFLYKITTLYAEGVEDRARRRLQPGGTSV